jgi:plasmid stability protein
MSELVLHDVDPKLVDRLALRAASTGRSVEEEAKLLLEDSVGLSHCRAVEAARRIRARSGGRMLSDSAELIREDRER